MPYNIHNQRFWGMSLPYKEYFKIVYGCFVSVEKIYSVKCMYYESPDRKAVHMISAEYQHWINAWLHQYWHIIEQTMKQYILVTALMVLQVIGMHWVPVRTLLLILRDMGWVLVLLHIIGFVLVLVILVLVLPQVIGWVEQQAGYMWRGSNWEWCLKGFPWLLLLSSKKAKAKFNNKSKRTTLF